MKDSVKYGILSIVCGIVSYFIFWWLAFVGLGLGIRSLKAGEGKILGILGIIISGIAGCLYFGFRIMNM